VLKSLITGAAAVGAPRAVSAELKLGPTYAEAAPAPILELKDFQPKSMLHVPVTQITRAKFPVIDVHTHLSFAAKLRAASRWARPSTWPPPRRTCCR
jgi:hypothetical protein